MDMVATNLSEQELKQVLKAALAETLVEQREFLHEVFLEVIEDFALAQAIREGQDTKNVPREEIMGILRGKK
jgi:hypothetical protein